MVFGTALLWGILAALAMPSRFAAAAEESGEKADFSPRIATAAPDSGNAPLEQVIVVFKTHYDIGFTGLARDVVKYYRTEMLAKTVKACAATAGNPAGKRFTWTMASWPMAQILQGETDPDLLKQAEDLVKHRQLVWHALPFTMHTEFFGLEDLIRTFYISRDLSMRFGIWPEDAKMTDVPGHTWILPSLSSRRWQ